MRRTSRTVVEKEYIPLWFYDRSHKNIINTAFPKMTNIISDIFMYDLFRLMITPAPLLRKYLLIQHLLLVMMIIQKLLFPLALHQVLQLINLAIQISTLHLARIIILKSNSTISLAKTLAQYLSNDLEKVSFLQNTT